MLEEVARDLGYEWVEDISAGVGKERTGCSGEAGSWPRNRERYTVRPSSGGAGQRAVPYGGRVNRVRRSDGEMYDFLREGRTSHRRPDGQTRRTSGTSRTSATTAEAAASSSSEAARAHRPASSDPRPRPLGRQGCRDPQNAIDLGGIRHQ